MQRCFMVRFSEPRDFNIEELLAGTGKFRKLFRYDVAASSIRLYYNDLFGMYEARKTLGSDNWIAYLTFSIDNYGRVSSIAKGHHGIPVKTILYELTRTDSESPEYHLLRDFVDQITKQMKQVVDETARGSAVKYNADQTPERGAVVAGVFQRHYGCAHGPHDGINYIGTYGIGPCVGAAVVTHVEGEEYPRVSVIHIDEKSELDRSISQVLCRNGHGEGRTEVALLSGDRSDKCLINVANAFDKHGIKPACDLGGGQQVSYRRPKDRRYYGPR